VAASLPEARIFFPQLSVLNGLGTRVPVRDFVAYKDVQPLEHQGTRQYSIRSQRLILCAQSPPLESGGEEWRDCVLKAFDVEDIKMLRRSVHALSQLSHPNIIPLWSVVENVAEKRWYLEFPHIALDLRAFMEETEEEVEPEVPAAENEEEVEPEVPAAENEEEKTADPNDTLPLVDTNAEVQAKKRVPKERSLHVLSGLLSGVLRGIACLHSHGLIHRDIKVCILCVLEAICSFLFIHICLPVSVAA
jgi:serine/threonine protein kinase